MKAEDRFTVGLARQVHEKLLAGGDMFLSLTEIQKVANDQGVENGAAEHILRRLESQGLLEIQGGHLFRGTVAFAWLYETQFDRQEHWRQNVVRRDLLEAARPMYEGGDREGARYLEGQWPFAERGYAEAVAAAHVVDFLGFAKLHLYFSQSFRVTLTPEGYDLVRDPVALARTLPISAAEDDEAHTPIAADALDEIIRSCEQLLDRRGWTGALNELRLGDDQCEQRHWVDAVREYYRALESGLKYRLDEMGEAYAPGAALRDLAGQGVRVGAIPINYQALFSFADSVRSPRSHGAGGAAEEIEVGQAEALLLGNLVRTLLLYLGHRPR